MKMPAGLDKKVGPLPLGVWLILVGAGLAIGLYLRKRGAGKAPTGTLTGEPDEDYLSGLYGTQGSLFGSAGGVAVVGNPAAPLPEPTTPSTTMPKCVGGNCDPGPVATPKPVSGKPVSITPIVSPKPVIVKPKKKAEKKYKEITYTIKKGDTFWDLAKKYLGDPYKFRDILKYNNLTYADTRTQVPGKKIKIRIPT